MKTLAESLAELKLARDNYDGTKISLLAIRLAALNVAKTVNDEIFLLELKSKSPFEAQDAVMQRMVSEI